jgi:hypothetical protein
MGADGTLIRLLPTRMVQMHVQTKNIRLALNMGIILFSEAWKIHEY